MTQNPSGPAPGRRRRAPGSGPRAPAGLRRRRRVVIATAAARSPRSRPPAGRADGQAAAAGGHALGDAGEAQPGPGQQRARSAGARSAVTCRCPLPGRLAGIGHAHRDVPGLVAQPDRGPGRLWRAGWCSSAPPGRCGTRSGPCRAPARPGCPRSRNRPAVPCPRTWSSTSPSSPSEAKGAVSSRADGRRSTPRSLRSSVSAWRAVSPMTSTDRRAWSGRPGSSEAAASAWTAIRLTWWATTSCSSRAIRIRSRSAACEDWRSSSASARSARLCAAWTLARMARLSRPAAAAVSEDHHLEDGVVRLVMARRGLGDPDGRRQDQAGDPAPGRAAAVEDGVERDSRPERERREPEPDLVIGHPRRAPMTNGRRRRASSGARRAGVPCGGDQHERRPQRMQLSPVRQQRDHVDGGQRDTQAGSGGVPDAVAGARPAAPSAAAGPARATVHDPMVRRGARPGDPPEDGSGRCDRRRRPGPARGPALRRRGRAGSSPRRPMCRDALPGEHERHGY